MGRRQTTLGAETRRLGGGSHSIIDREKNDDEVSKGMHYEPASRTAAAQKHVDDCKGEDAEQHLDEDVEDFSFPGGGVR